MPNKGPSQIYATDIDGDGDADVVAADWAHGEGLVWYEQTTPLNFVRHMFWAAPQDIDRFGAFSRSPTRSRSPTWMAMVTPTSSPVNRTSRSRSTTTIRIRWARPTSMSSRISVAYRGRMTAPSRSSRYKSTPILASASR